MTRIASPGEGPLARARVALRVLVPALFIVGLATLSLLPIFLRGFPNGDDASIHGLWAAEFANALREGVVYPRWLAGLNEGAGSPSMVYYPPVTPYLHAALYLATGSVPGALAIGSWLALILSGFTMYAFARLHLTRAYSLVAVALYMIAPYHLFDLYHRAALAELWGFAFLPLVLHGVHRVVVSDFRSVAYLAVGYSLMLLTHLVLSFAISLVLLVYAVVITRDWRRIFRLATGVTLGVCLAGMLVVPVAFEMRFVAMDVALIDDYRTLFLFENLRSAVEHPASGVYGKHAVFIRYSNAIALTALALFAMSVVVLLWYRRHGEARRLWESKAFKASLVITTASFFMTTRLSAPVWGVITPLKYLQFPTRWLTIAALGVSLVVAGLFSMTFRCPFIKSRIFSISMLALAVLANVSLSALIAMRAPFDTAGLQARMAENTRIAPEYLPVWARTQPELQQALSIVKGDGDIIQHDNRRLNQRYTVIAETPSVLRFLPFYFPGWVARVDGKAANIFPGSTGQIHLALDPGEHRIDLSFEDTAARIAGKIVSAVGMLLLGAIIFGRRPRQQ